MIHFQGPLLNVSFVMSHVSVRITYYIWRVPGSTHMPEGTLILYNFKSRRFSTTITVTLVL
jgi:hypothetical protein